LKFVIHKIQLQVKSNHKTTNTSKGKTLLNKQKIWGLKKRQECGFACLTELFAAVRAEFGGFINEAPTLWADSVGGLLSWLRIGWWRSIGLLGCTVRLLVHWLTANWDGFID
jgi:hypothetical protein